MTAGQGRHGQSGLHPARECLLRKNVTPHDPEASLAPNPRAGRPTPSGRP